MSAFPIAAIQQRSAELTAEHRTGHSRQLRARSRVPCHCADKPAVWPNVLIWHRSRKPTLGQCAACAKLRLCGMTPTLDLHSTPSETPRFGYGRCEPNKKGWVNWLISRYREDLEIWLSERPVAFVYADCVSLSSRIALRILPRVSAASIGDAERFRNLIVLPVFRAVQLSCALAMETTNTVNLREVIKRAQSSIDLGERTAASFDAYAARLVTRKELLGVKPQFQQSPFDARAILQSRLSSFFKVR